MSGSIWYAKDGGAYEEITGTSKVVSFSNNLMIKTRKGGTNDISIGRFKIILDLETPYEVIYAKFGGEKTKLDIKPKTAGGGNPNDTVTIEDDDLA